MAAPRLSQVKVIRLLVRRLRQDARRAVGRAGEHPVPAAVIDRVVAQVAAQADAVADQREALLRLAGGFGGKGLVAAGDGAAQDQLHALLRFGQGELQPLLDFLLLAGGWRCSSLICSPGHRFAGRVFGADPAVENHSRRGSAGPACPARHPTRPWPGRWAAARRPVGREFPGPGPAWSG